jgi:hypothetical protein
MTKQRYGPASEKITKSRGPVTNNATSAYHTSYISSFSRGVLEKHPIKKKLEIVKRQTGYNANFRPCVYYTPELDDLDNPSLKLKVSEHYKTSNDNDFRPYTTSPSGREMNLVNQVEDILPSASGFTTMRSPAYIQKTSKEVKNSYITKGHYLNQSINGKAVYCQRNSKDPIANENLYTGPKPMSTENTSRYQGQQGRWPTQTWRFHKSVGCKEPTANTRVEPFDPIEYNTRNPYRSDIKSSNYHNRYHRPIGISEQEHNFIEHPFHVELSRNSQHSTSANGIPQPTPKSNRDTGYSLETTVPRYTDNYKYPINDNSYLSTSRSDPYKCTLARYSFTAPGRSRGGDSKLNRDTTGNKEATGYVKNHPSYNQTVETNLKRFHTHYDAVFLKDQKETKENMIHQATLALSSSGWPAFKAENGFTKSTKVHTH